MKLFLIIAALSMVGCGSRRFCQPSKGSSDYTTYLKPTCDKGLTGISVMDERKDQLQEVQPVSAPAEGPGTSEEPTAAQLQDAESDVPEEQEEGEGEE